MKVYVMKIIHEMITTYPHWSTIYSCYKNKIIVHYWYGTVGFLFFVVKYNIESALSTKNRHFRMLFK